MLNVFEKAEVANEYDAYYQTEFGKKVDDLEKAIVKELIKDIDLGNMLELGCGTGHWTAFFEENGFEITGLDASDAMLEIAREKNLKADFIKGDALSLPYPDHSFSIVSSITMLEFVNDQDKVLDEMYRVLKHGGYLILGCLNASSVLAQNKESSDTFRNAKFFNYSELMDKLSLVGTPQIKQGVYLKPNFSIIESDAHKNSIEPVFMGAIVQKQ